MNYLRKISEFLIYTLIIVLPWHSLIIYGYIQKYIPLIIYWKEIVIFILLFFSVIFHYKSYYTYQLEYLAFITLILLAFSILFALEPTVVSAYGLRYNVIALLALVIGILIPVNENVLQNCVKIIGFIAIISLLFGLIQAYYLGSDVLINAGYPSSQNTYRDLKYSFYIGGSNIQRVNSGFSGPLAFSFFMFFIFVIYSSNTIRSIYFPKIVKLVSIIGMIVGFSRSLIIAAIIFFVLNKNYSAIKKFIILFIIISTLLFSMFVGWTLKIPYFVMAYEHLLNSITLTDRSIIGHFDSLKEGYDLIVKHGLYGMGLGTIGPNTEKYIDNILIPESTYISMWLENGLIVFLISMLFYIFLIMKNLNNFISKYLLSLTFVMAFLPLQYYSEVTIIICLVIGLYIQHYENRGRIV